MNPHFSPRHVNVVVGIWLFVSANLWRHSVGQFNNTWLLGVIATVAAVAALSVDAVRYVNVALAIWLFASAWLLPVRDPLTFWNDLIIALVMFIVAVVPSAHVQRRRTSLTRTASECGDE
jgi:hypothetical protein